MRDKIYERTLMCQYLNLIAQEDQTYIKLTFISDILKIKIYLNENEPIL